MKIARKFHHTALLLMGLMLVWGCRWVQIDSKWRDSEIHIDGKDQEWLDVLTMPPGQRVAVGVANDDSALYLSLRTADRNAITQIMGFGLTIWVDSRGGTKKKLGFNYPVIEDIQSMRGGLWDRHRPPEKMERWIEMVLASQFGIEITGPGKGDLARMPLKSKSGLELAASYSQGQFVYELRIPFQTDPEEFYAIQSRPGKTIGIGIQASRPAIAVMRGPGTVMLGGRPPGGPGGIPGMGGGMRSGRSRKASQMPLPLEFWLKISLAERD